MKNPPNLANILGNLGSKMPHQIWLCSTLNLKRNFSNFLFPHKLSKERQYQLFDLISHNLGTDPEFSAKQVYLAKDLKPVEKDLIAEHFFSENSFYQTHASEGFFMNDAVDLLITANMGDHLNFLKINTNQELEHAFNHLMKLEQRLGYRLQFAFDSKFGFLTSKASECGTALVVSLFFHIPATIHLSELAELTEKNPDHEILWMGIQGKPNEMIGDLCVIKNKYTLGLSEEQILTTMRMWATKVVVTELAHRKKLKENPSEEMKNKVSKAFGILSHAYQLDTVESLNTLSLVQLGVELGWIEAPSSYQFSSLILRIRRGHLLQLQKDEDLHALPKQRAAMLQECLKSMKLKV